MSSWPYGILAILLTLTSLLASVPATAVVGAQTLTSLTLNPTTVNAPSTASPAEQAQIEQRAGQLLQQLQ